MGSSKEGVGRRGVAIIVNLRIPPPFQLYKDAESEKKKAYTIAGNSYIIILRHSSEKTNIYKKTQSSLRVFNLDNINCI